MCQYFGIKYIDRLKTVKNTNFLLTVSKNQSHCFCHLSVLIDIAKLKEKKVTKNPTNSQSTGLHTAVCTCHYECFIHEMFSSMDASLALGCAIPKYKVGLIFIGAYSSLSSLCNLTFAVLLCKSGQHLSVGVAIKKEMWCSTCVINKTECKYSSFITHSRVYSCCWMVLTTVDKPSERKLYSVENLRKNIFMDVHKYTYISSSCSADSTC